MIFKNSLSCIFFIFLTISCFSSTLAHNLHRRQTDDEKSSNCTPIYKIDNGKITPLQEYSEGSPVPDQAIFNITCEENYELSPQIQFIKCVDGLWNSTFPSCLPKRSLNEAEENKLEEEYCGDWDSDFQAPWHVGLYEKVGKEYRYFCGGSIVSPNVIITAAHCLTNDDGKNINPIDLYITAGKYKSDYKQFEWTAQYEQSKKYEIPESYKGAQSNLEGDLALIVLQKPFSSGYFVHPACIDWKNKFEDEQLNPGNIGYVQGWGYKDLVLKTPSDILQQLNVPVIEKQQCFDTTPKDFHPFLTDDKFCAGYTNGSCICNGDDGGGLIFGKADNKGIKYYIRGLVSTFPKKNGACDMFQYAVYTKISSHKNFIERVINENKIKKNKNP